MAWKKARQKVFLQKRKNLLALTQLSVKFSDAIFMAQTFINENICKKKFEKCTTIESKMAKNNDQKSLLQIFNGSDTSIH